MRAVFIIPLRTFSECLIQWQMHELDCYTMANLSLNRINCGEKLMWAAGMCSTSCFTTSEACLDSNWAWLNMNTNVGVAAIILWYNVFNQRPIAWQLVLSTQLHKSLSSHLSNGKSMPSTTPAWLTVANGIDISQRMCPVTQNEN